MQACNNSFTSNEITVDVEFLLKKDSVCKYRSVEGILLEAICQRDSSEFRSGHYACEFSQKGEKSFIYRKNGLKSPPSYEISYWYKGKGKSIRLEGASKNEFIYKTNLDTISDQWVFVKDTVSFSQKSKLYSTYLKLYGTEKVYVDDYKIRILFEE